MARRAKSISGFKVSADKRDAIQELREDAAEKRFDVLLVFMFDRLGRRDDETPFVVEWFARQGIRIFSVKEGEQKFESHTDSLINYIRYWQSEEGAVLLPVLTGHRLWNGLAQRSGRFCLANFAVPGTAKLASAAHSAASKKHRFASRRVWTSCGQRVCILEDRHITDTEP